jgi:ABC-type cobalt transport system substrate-binding protein
LSQNKQFKKAVSAEGFIFLVIFLGIFISIGSVMGTVNMFNTLMNTAYKLLIETVFYILAIAVLAGAISALLSEFGVVSIINKILSPLMKPLYDLPGAATIGILATYLSDNPAILTLADDKGFRRYFKKYQLPALTNLGTAFGMGLIVTTYMIGQKSPVGESFILPAIIGNIGAVVGSIVSTRIMLRFTSKIYGKNEYCIKDDGEGIDMINYREIRQGSVGGRVMDALLEGGKSGVEMGLAIIPGVLIICTLVLMLTNGPSPTGEYTGAAYEGVKLLPWIGGKLSFILNPLFGFQSAEAIAFPITSLGAVGAAIGLVPKMLEQGLIGGNEIAVFTAMGMCWSGYLSTHVAMMDGLKCRELTGRAILSHTFGGLAAGIAAHFLYVLFL